MTGVQTCALPICFPVTICAKHPGVVQLIALNIERKMKPFNTGLIQTGWNACITDQFQNTPDLGVSRRGRRILDKLVASKQASPEAVQAMLNLVDPFPDSALEAVGWPDATGCPSVSFVDREEISISAPAGTTSSWNFHVTFSPYLS